MADPKDRFSCDMAQIICMEVFVTFAFCMLCDIVFNIFADIPLSKAKPFRVYVAKNCVFNVRNHISVLKVKEM